jgi:hypothetical protein
VKKFFLSLVLNLILSTSLIAHFDDRNGEDFVTDLGTVHRSRTIFQLTETDGTVHEMNKGALMFKKGATFSGSVVQKKLELRHAFSRAELIAALADYMSE